MRRAPVLIDQEGGRVQRLKPPTWPAYAPQAAIGALAALDDEAGRRAAWLQGRLIAADLHALGIDIDCAPVLDVAGEGVTEAIGNRAFGSDPAIVATLGRGVAEGLMAGGVLPVIKHIPGHGRAPGRHPPPAHRRRRAARPARSGGFRAFPGARRPAAGHDRPYHLFGNRPGQRRHGLAARDPRYIRGRIGFDGLLMSDDVSMHALSGDYADRAAAVYAAGCDIVLHCNGRTEEMRKIGGAAPALGGQSRERAARALQKRHRPDPFDAAAAREEYRALLARVGWPAAS